MSRDEMLAWYTEIQQELASSPRFAWLRELLASTPEEPT